MTLTTAHVSISLDGFIAGPDQSADDPLGRGGMALHRWHFDAERPGHEVDARWTAMLLRQRGAYVMGRNMFGPVRGPWSSYDGDWRGWWGEEPPYHAPVFVLTHYDREPVEMAGGTTFHFVTEGFDAALAMAREAGDGDVDVAGGASAVRQALRSGELDELTLDIAPVLLGSGERIFDGDMRVGFELVQAEHSPWATHVRYRIRHSERSGESPEQRPAEAPVGRSAEDPGKHLGAHDFEAAYASGRPPWDVGRPQAAFRELADQGHLAGRVLDVGCGTGEHALMAAALGLDATGVDSAGTAIDIARRKAHERGLRARFEVWDALQLGDLGESFDTVLDCGLFHVFEDAERPRFVAALRASMPVGATYHLLCFSDQEPGDWGPRRIRQDEIRASFADGWHVEEIEPAEIQTTLETGGARAWLASIRRV